MKRSSEYFKEANNHVNEEFLGFDDYDDDFENADDSWENANDDDWNSANAFGDALPMDDEYENARGRSRGMGVSQKGESQPYIIQIQNTTTADISNVVILNAAIQQSAAAPNYGNTAGISITYGLSNVTYTQFVASISSGRVFENGQLRLVASHSSAATAESQVLTTTTIETKDLNGNAITRPFIPQKDSYQQINTQVDIFYRFMVDALTSITFATLSANVTLKVYLYPFARVNQFKQVAGKGGAVRYRNPGTDRILAKRGGRRR